MSTDSSHRTDDAAPSERAQSPLPLGRVRALTLLLGFAVVFSVSVMQAWMIFDASPSEPQFRGIHEGNGLLPWGFLAAAVPWVASWLPRLHRRTSLGLLWICVALLAVTAIAWLAWALVGYWTTPVR